MSEVQRYCERPRKRQKIEDNEENQEDAKKAKGDWYYTLESESPVPTDEDDESIYSVQGRETDFARDTSDTSTNVWSESDVSVHKEFEVDSRSENDTPFLKISSSSEPENTVAVGFIAFYDSEVLADDSDTSKSSADNEIKNGNFLTCVQCNNPNNNPLYRYCQKCYQIRKANFSRNRPKRKPRARKYAEGGNATLSPRDSSSAELTVLVEDLSRTDSGLPSSQDTLDNNRLDRSADSIASLSTIGDDERVVGRCASSTSASSSSSARPTIRFHRGRCSSSLIMPKEILLDLSSSPESDNSELNRSGNRSICEMGDESRSTAAVDGPSPRRKLAKLFREDKGEGSATSIFNSGIEAGHHQTQVADNMCLICTVQPKNGAFMHGTNMHICCCYRCAVKVCKTNNNRCPICNRKVTQVLKAFYD